MKTIQFLIVATFFTFAANAAGPQKGRVSDFLFRLIPVEQAHLPFGSAGLEALNPLSIKTLIWNIKKTQKPNWKKEFNEFSRGKDLLLLQEAYTNTLFKETALAMSGYRWDMGISFLYKRYANTPTGTMIGSLARPNEVLIKHTTDEEPLVGTPKSLVFAKYPIGDGSQELLAISVHGINLTSQASFERHMAQAENEISEHQGPVIFAGDFNTRTKRRTRYLRKLAKRLKLNEVKFEHARHRMVWKFTKNYLDHAYVRGLNVVTAKVLKDSTGSDHKPMVLELALETGPDSAGP